MAGIKGSYKVEGAARKDRAERRLVRAEVAADLDPRTPRGPRFFSREEPVGHFERIADDAVRAEERAFWDSYPDEVDVWDEFCYCSRDNPEAGGCSTCYALWA